MFKRLIALVVLLDICLVLTVAYFHADANPIMLADGMAQTQAEAVQATLNGGSGSGFLSSKVGGGSAGATSWNQSLFIKDVVIGIAIVSVINALLMFLISRRGVIRSQSKRSEKKLYQQIHQA